MIFRGLTNISRQTLSSWFEISTSKNTEEKYGHTLLIGKTEIDLEKMSEELRPYFEQAHRDARDVFHSEIGINLDPLTNGSRPVVSYPNSLPEKQKKGFFGEVFCGLLAQKLGTICGSQWVIPAYLFRHHDTASQYLHRLYYGESVSKNIVGRTGNDFLAICTDAGGAITGVLVGEAKCHKKYSTTLSKKVHGALAKERVIPVNLSKLKNLIKANYPGEFLETVSSIEDIVMNNKESALKRTDLFLFLFEDPAIKNYPPSRISDLKKDENHNADRHLQIYEIQLTPSGSLVKNLYKSLYKKPAPRKGSKNGEK